MNHDNYLKQFILIILLINSLFITIPMSVEGSNVADCFKEGVDCDELNIPHDNADQPDELDKGLEEREEAFDSDEKQPTSSLFKNFIQMILALILVLGLIYLMLKLVNRRQQLFSQTQTLENLGGISVGQNKSIQVIRVGTKMYLVGVGDNVQLLKEIDDEQTKTNLSHTQVKESMTFKEWIKSFLPIKKEQVDNSETNSFKHILTRELDQMNVNRQKIIQQFDKKDDTHE